MAFGNDHFATCVGERGHVSDSRIAKTNQFSQKRLEVSASPAGCLYALNRLTVDVIQRRDSFPLLDVG